MAATPDYEKIEKELRARFTPLKDLDAKALLVLDGCQKIGVMHEFLAKVRYSTFPLPQSVSLCQGEDGKGVIFRNILRKTLSSPGELNPFLFTVFNEKTKQKELAFSSFFEIPAAITAYKDPWCRITSEADVLLKDRQDNNSEIHTSTIWLDVCTSMMIDAFEIAIIVKQEENDAYIFLKDSTNGPQNTELWQNMLVKAQLDMLRVAHVIEDETLKEEIIKQLVEHNRELQAKKNKTRKAQKALPANRNPKTITTVDALSKMMESFTLFDKKQEKK